MSIVKEISELHISIKSFLGSILFIAPFWYIAIYLLHPGFYATNPFYIHLVFTFCFSVASFGCFLVLIDFSNRIESLKKHGREEILPATKEEDDHRIMVNFFICSFLCIVWLGIFICACFAFKLNFYVFLVAEYIPAGLVILLLMIEKRRLKKLRIQ